MARLSYDCRNQTLCWRRRTHRQGRRWLPTEGTSLLQLPKQDNNIICPNNPENVFNLGALTVCLQIWEPRRRSETSSWRSARSPSGFFSPEPGDHGAAETVDERQSAGIREEDKAESVKREAGL